MLLIAKGDFVMRNRVLSGFLPIGLLIKIVSGISGYYNLIDDFAKGFLDGISMVFVIAGLVLFVPILLSKKTA